MNTYQIIEDAIRNKKIVTAHYGGYYREMCPTNLGFCKSGHQQALFYQVGGTSKSGLGPSGSSDNWRCLPLDKLSTVASRSAAPGEWKTGPRHSQPQTCVKRSLVVVAY